VLRQIIHRIKSREEGVSGLESTILLIAFTVVATVFAYSATSAGIFSGQQSGGAADRGLNEIGSTLELRNSVLAYKANDSIGVGKLEFVINHTMKQSAVVDLTPPYLLSSGAPIESGLPYTTIVSYNDNSTSLDDCVWTLDWAGKHNDDYFLEGSEKAILTVWLHQYDGSVWTDNATSPPYLGPGNHIEATNTITIELKTRFGAGLIIERTMPTYLRNVMDLH
jgi:archaeal flagellin FlaB